MTNWRLRYTWLIVAWASTLGAMPLLVFADEEQEASGKVEEYVQELFLGQSVYPQDTGELQVTVGHFWNNSDERNSTLPLLLEYGLTDSFQVGVMLPMNFAGPDSEPRDGLGNVEFEAYWNFLNDGDTGWASGVGFAYSLPTAKSVAGENAHIFEPFLVLYKDFGHEALNCSTALEVADPRDPDENQETSGNVDLAYLYRSAQLPVVWLLEAGTEFNAEETAVQVAPGAYFHPKEGNWEVGCSLPIGLNGNSPALGFSVLFTVEFQ